MDHTESQDAAPLSQGYFAEVLERVTDAIAGQVRSLRERLQTHSLRQDVLEDRIVQLGLQRAKAGKDGLQGPPGPIGPMPAHRWDGTKLQFQQGPSGEQWGEEIDLQGPRGLTGRSGGGGGGGVAAAPNSWFPSGW